MAARLRHSVSLLLGEWIQPGMHIAFIGADMPHKSELHPDVYRQADKWVTDLINQSLITGEIARAIEQGAINEKTLHAPLGEIVAGREAGREDDAEITEAVGDSGREGLVTPISFSFF